MIENTSTRGTIELRHSLPSLGTLLRESWQKVATAWQPLAGLVLISWLPLVIGVPAFAVLVTGAERLGSTGLSVVALTVAVVTVMAQLVLQSIVITGQIHVLAVGPIAIRAALHHASRRWLPFLGVSLALAILSFIGLGAIVLTWSLILVGLAAAVNTAWGIISGVIVAAVLGLTLIIVDVYVQVRLAFALFLTARGRESNPFRHSWRLTRGYVWSILWRTTIAGFVASLTLFGLQVVIVVSTGPHQIVRNSIAGLVVFVGSNILVLYLNAFHLTLLQLLECSAPAAPIPVKISPSLYKADYTRGTYTTPKKMTSAFRPYHQRQQSRGLQG